jgi:hypothetical protein
MSYIAIAHEAYLPPALPERPFLDSVRLMASTVVHNVTSLPEFNIQGDLRSLTDGVVYKDDRPKSARGGSGKRGESAAEATIIPAEDPEVVRKRDKAGCQTARLGNH